MKPARCAEASVPNPGTRKRLAALDWARGCMLVLSVTVNSLLFMPAWFDHSPWDGVHPIDLVFPLFVTLSGCGLAFAMSRGVRFLPLLRRVVVLAVLGLAYNAVMSWSIDPATWRFTGVLQLYALIVPGVALLHLVTWSARGWAALTAAFAIAHSALLLISGSECRFGILTRECNPSGPIDATVFGTSHTYAQGALGHDPEGLVVLLGAMVSASAGATVGHLMRALAARRSAESKAAPVWDDIRPMALHGAFFVLLAWFLVYVYALPFGAQLPVMKRMWTAPFALGIAAIAILLLIAGYLVNDRKPQTPFGRRASFPLIAMGRNSLLVYFGSHVLTRVLDQPFGSGGLSIAQRFVMHLPSPLLAQLLWTGALLGGWVLLAMLLHRRKIYLRA